LSIRTVVKQLIGVEYACDQYSFLADRILVTIELLAWLSSVRLSVTDVLRLTGRA